MYKYSLSKGENKIWIQFVKEEINLFSCYYFEDGANDEFKEIIRSSEINEKVKIDHRESKSELMKLFFKQIEIANKSFAEYDKTVTKKQ